MYRFFQPAKNVILKKKKKKNLYLELYKKDLRHTLDRYIYLYSIKLKIQNIYFKKNCTH